MANKEGSDLGCAEWHGSLLFEGACKHAKNKHPIVKKNCPYTALSKSWVQGAEDSLTVILKMISVSYS